MTASEVYNLAAKRLGNPDDPLGWVKDGLREVASACDAASFSGAKQLATNLRNAAETGSISEIRWVAAYACGYLDAKAGG